MENTTTPVSVAEAPPLNKGQLFLAHLSLAGIASSFALVGTAPLQHNLPTAVVLIKSHGIHSLWSGSLSLLRNAPTLAFVFAVKEQLHMILMPQKREKEMPIWTKLAANFTIGGAAGTIGRVVLHPIRNANEIWASNLEKPEFRTRMEMLKKTGVRGLYKNFLSMPLFTSFVFSGICFGLYDSLKSSYGGEKSRFDYNLLFGLAAGSSAMLVYTPLLVYTQLVSEGKTSSQSLRLMASHISSVYRGQKMLVGIVSVAVTLSLFDHFKLLFIEDRIEKKNNITTLAVDTTLGGIAGAGGKLLSAPLDRSSLLLSFEKTQPKRPDVPSSFKGVFSRFIQSEGLAALWRGTGANVVRYVPTTSVNFAAKDFLERTICFSERNEFFGKRLALNMAAGGIAGVASLFMVYPSDIARVRIAQEANRNRKMGQPAIPPTTLTMIKQIYKTENMVGLYKGFVPSVIGIAVYRSLYFGIYDSIKPDGLSLFSFPLHCLLAYSATLFAGAAAVPIDNVRRRITLSPPPPLAFSPFSPPFSPYSSPSYQAFSFTAPPDIMLKNNNNNNTMTSSQAVKSIIATDGAKGLFKGITNVWLRSATGAAVLVLYELLQSLTYRKPPHPELPEEEEEVKGGDQQCRHLYPCLCCTFFSVSSTRDHLSDPNGRVLNGLWNDCLPSPLWEGPPLCGLRVLSIVDLCGTTRSLPPSLTELDCSSVITRQPLPSLSSLPSLCPLPSLPSLPFLPSPLSPLPSQPPTLPPSHPPTSLPPTLPPPLPPSYLLPPSHPPFVS